ncbi:MAG: 50S ribosomal protein L24 [Clostridiales bacterium]|nr:50S ribosomal protein L24 [Clostridiales bacterium]
MALNIKKGDNVIVIAGKDKGKSGKVLSSNPAKFTVVVEGVNEITKHVKPRSAQQQGGIVKENGSINASNVMLLCPICNKGVRFTVKTETVDGKEVKVRICKKCGAVLEFKAEEAKVAKKKTVRKKSAKKAEENTEVAENAEVVEATEEAPKKKTVRKKTVKTEEAPATEEVKTEAKKTVRKKSAKTTDETSNA